MTEPESSAKPSPVFEAIGGFVFLLFAAALAYGVWWALDDAVSSWRVTYGPEGSDRPSPTWFEAFHRTGGFYWLLLLLPSIGLGIPGWFMLRDAIRQWQRSQTESQ